MTLKSRIHRILHEMPPGDDTARLVNAVLLTLITLNVAAFVIETVEPVYRWAPRAFALFEFVSVAVFTLEYLARVWSCTASAEFAGGLRGRLRFVRTPMAVVDLLAVAPYWLPMVGLDLRVIRALRLGRIFRVLKLGRYSLALQTFGRVLVRKREELTTVLFVIGLLLLLAASLMYFAEHEVQPEKFGSIPESMWWGIATLTTVGYGDVYPVTPLGRVLGAIIAVLGIGMFALPTGILGAAFVEDLQRNSSGACCPHCGGRLDEAPDPDGGEVAVHESVGN